METYKKILQKGIISSELELERMLVVERKLRLLGEENPEFKEDRKHLRAIIKAYEKTNWSSQSEISDEKIKESDTAEYIAEQERQFLDKRKEIIKSKMATYGLNQQDLGTLLGHNKAYTSELINGVNPFSLKDLIIIHRLFKIKLESLIPTTIAEKDRGRIKLSLQKINKPKLKFTKKDLEFA